MRRVESPSLRQVITDKPRVSVQAKLVAILISGEPMGARHVPTKMVEGMPADVALSLFADVGQFSAITVQRLTKQRADGSSSVVVHHFAPYRAMSSSRSAFVTTSNGCFSADTLPRAQMNQAVVAPSLPTPR